MELAFVIGRRGKHIKVSVITSPPTAESLHLCCNICSTSVFLPLAPQEEDALSYVAGFTVANDVSARDWQMKRNGKQWLLGKTFDSFCPLGPALVTMDAMKGEIIRINMRNYREFLYCLSAPSQSFTMVQLKCK